MGKEEEEWGSLGSCCSDMQWQTGQSLCCHLVEEEARKQHLATLGMIHYKLTIKSTQSNVANPVRAGGLNKGVG